MTNVMGVTLMDILTDMEEEVASVKDGVDSSLEARDLDCNSLIDTLYFLSFFRGFIFLNLRS